MKEPISVIWRVNLGMSVLVVYRYKSAQDVSAFFKKIKIILFLLALFKRMNLRSSKHVSRSGTTGKQSDGIPTFRTRSLPTVVIKNYSQMKHSDYYVLWLWPLARSTNQPAIRFKEPLCLVTDYSKIYVTNLKVSLKFWCWFSTHH